MNTFIENISSLITDDLRNEEKHDPYQRKFTYNPIEDVKILFDHSITERILQKDVIQILTDIHLLKWSSINDTDWFIIC